MTDTPGDDQEPTDAELRSDEARRYRQQLRTSEATNAELIRSMAAVTERAEAAERQVVNAELRSRFTDTEDFWSRTQLDELRRDDGALDMSKAAAQADQLLTEHPHWKAAPVHGAAPAEIVNASGKIGFGPVSVLDGDNAEPQPVRSFAQFLNDAQHATQPE